MKDEFDMETLSAYLDGELDSARATEVKAAILRDPELRARLDRLDRPVQAVKRALDVITAEPLPDSLLALTRSRPPEQAQSRWPSLAAAASIAVVVGVIAGVAGNSVLTGDDPASAWQAVQDPAALRHLDSLASGVEVELASGAGALSLRPVFTFIGDEGAVCRQYTVEDGESGDVADAVACRVPSTGWSVEVARSRQPNAHNGEGMSYTPASGAKGGFNRLVGTLIRQPVDPDQERELIRSGWQRPAD